MLWCMEHSASTAATAPPPPASCADQAPLLLPPCPPKPLPLPHCAAERLVGRLLLRQGQLAGGRLWQRRRQRRVRRRVRRRRAGGWALACAAQRAACVRCWLPWCRLFNRLALSAVPARLPPPPLAVGHAPGGFRGAAALELWVKTDSGRPKLAINVGAGSVRGGKQRRGGCWGTAQRTAGWMHAARLHSAHPLLTAAPPAPACPPSSDPPARRSTAPPCPWSACRPWRAAAPGPSSPSTWGTWAASE